MSSKNLSRRIRCLAYHEKKFNGFKKKKSNLTKLKMPGSRIYDLCSQISDSRGFDLLSIGNMRLPIDNSSETDLYVKLIIKTMNFH